MSDQPEMIDGRKDRANVSGVALGVCVAAVGAGFIAGPGGVLLILGIAGFVLSIVDLMRK